MSLCCISSVVSYSPTHVVSEHASGFRCGLPISDLSHRLGQPAMTPICEPQPFFEHLTPFFRWIPIPLGLFERNLESGGFEEGGERPTPTIHPGL